MPESTIESRLANLEDMRSVDAMHREMLGERLILLSSQIETITRRLDGLPWQKYEDLRPSWGFGGELKPQLKEQYRVIGGVLYRADSPASMWRPCLFDELREIAKQLSKL